MGKRILFINSSLGNGGSERVMTLLANEFSQRNYQVDMLIENNVKESYPLDENINRIFFDSHNACGFKYVFSWVKKIRRTMKAGSYNVVISFMMRNNVLALLANIGLKNQIIVSERCDPRRIEDYGILFKAGERLLYPLAKKIVLQTEEVKNYYGKSIRKNATVIPNPINQFIQCEADKKRRRTVFVAVGRLHEQKNYPMLLRAFSLFSKEIEGYTLEIFGQGPLLEKLQSLCHELNIEDKVLFKGYVNNVHEYMRTATAFVMTSNYEGISNAMLESLGMGLPTICTDCPVGGARMMIKPNINGILIPVGNEEACASAMLKVVRDEEFAAKLCREAVKIRNEYSISTIADMWQEIIDF